MLRVVDRWACKEGGPEDEEGDGGDVGGVVADNSKVGGGEMEMGKVAGKVGEPEKANRGEMGNGEAGDVDVADQARRERKRGGASNDPSQSAGIDEITSPDSDAKRRVAGSNGSDAV